MARLKAVALLLLLIAVVASDPAERQFSRYIVLGAGPGGLQIAHYLESAGRDYVVLDRASSAGSFFDRYPRWRQLISINKREVGRTDSLAFAERHDWNSLLSDASHCAVVGRRRPMNATPPTSSTDARLDVDSVAASLRFTSWSSDYYPRADVLREYLGAWASAGSGGGNASDGSQLRTRGLGRRRALRVLYGIDVTRIERPPGWREGGAGAAGTPRFHLSATVAGVGASPALFSCHFLIVATGLGEEVPMPGRNGSAAVAAGLIQTYATASAAEAGGGAGAYRGQRVLILGHGNAAFEFAHHVLPTAAYVHVAGRDSRRLSLALETHYPGAVRAVHAGLLETYNLKSLDGITSADFARLSFARAAGGGVAVRNGAAPCRHDVLGRSTSRCSFRRPYDAVVACLGWRMDRRAFAPDVLPRLAPNGKHPAATPRYEALGVPGLYFAGTLAHGADHRRSSGGFIHGFRYTARALHRILEEEEDGEAVAGGAAAVEVGPAGAFPRGASAPTPAPCAWPTTRVRGLRALVALILRRVNSGAGLYQMFGALADVFVLDPAPPPPPGFSGAGPHAAMLLPWSHYDEGAAAAAAAGSDPTGLAADVAAGQARQPRGAPPRPPRAAASEAAIDAALAGGLREEVPVGLVPEAVRRWAAAAGGGGGAAEWLSLTLEFGPSAPPGKKDPFALDRCACKQRGRQARFLTPQACLRRANVDLDQPERSHFIHPVLRYYHSHSSSSSSGPGDGSGCEGRTGGGGSCAPIATLHIAEDFLAGERWGLQGLPVP